jgi:hypothetical protein
MKLDLEHAIEVLTRTPDVLQAMLGELSLPWVMNNYGADTFSPFEFWGHHTQLTRGLER